MRDLSGVTFVHTDAEILCYSAKCKRKERKYERCAGKFELVMLIILFF